MRRQCAKSCQKPSLNILLAALECSDTGYRSLDRDDGHSVAVSALTAVVAAVQAANARSRGLLKAAFRQG
jgi:hypothetical protein